MRRDEIKSWQHDGATCKLWRLENGAFRGAVFHGREAVACAEVVERFGEARARAAVEALVPTMQPPSGVWVIKEDTPVTDVVFVPLAGSLSRKNVEFLQRPIKLAPDIEVLPPNWDLARTVFAACDPPGKHHRALVDLRTPLYTIVRYNAPQRGSSQWDSDQRLQLCIGLSRLVRPTSIALGHTVRIVGDLSSARHKVIPGPIHGFGSQAWTSRPARDWLDAKDFVQLRRLLSAQSRRPFAKRSRLQRALWYFEYTARTHFVDVRWPMMTTIAETLLSTSDDSTRNFVQRIPQVAEKLEIPISKKEASEMWRSRSRIIHGSAARALNPEDLRLYALLEDLVRVMLRKALLDRKFRKLLSSEQSIDEAFPVTARPPTVVACLNCKAEIPTAR
jgi:hypothetical protein